MPATHSRACSCSLPSRVDKFFLTLYQLKIRWLVVGMRAQTNLFSFNEGVEVED